MPRKCAGSSRSTSGRSGRCMHGCAPALAVGALRRCTPIAEGCEAARTRSVTDARAARLVVHRCTRGSKCRAHRAIARELLLPSAAQNPLVHVVLCRAKRCGTGARRMPPPITHDAERVHLSADAADGRGVVLQAKQLRPAKAEVRPLVPQYVESGPSTHSVEACVGAFRSNRISAHAPPTLQHCWGNPFFSEVGLAGWEGGGAGVPIL